MRNFEPENVRISELKPKLEVRIEKRDTTLFARVKPSTKEFFEHQAKLANASSIGQYFDVLAETWKLQK